MGNVGEGAPGAGAHGGEVAQVDRQRLVADSAGRGVRPEVDSGDEGVERDRDGAGVLGAPDPGRHGLRRTLDLRSVDPSLFSAVTDFMFLATTGFIACHGITTATRTVRGRTGCP